MSNESKALELAVKSRLLCKKLRTTPMSISDLIPHLQATADAVERQHAQIEALEKQLEAVRKDAERYRWLRDEAQWLHGVPQAIVWRNDGKAQEICAEEELDEAIDAARSAHEH